MKMYCPTVAKAVAEAGGQRAVAIATKRVQPAVFKWTRKGLPRTEWTGESDFASRICQLANENPDRTQDWTREDLLTRDLEPLGEKVPA